MASIEVFKAVIYWLVALAFALMAFWALVHLWHRWKRPETVRADIEAGGGVDLASQGEGRVPLSGTRPRPFR